MTVFEPSLVVKGPAEVLSLLRSERYEELEQHLSEVQQGYERGHLSEDQLCLAFSAFNSEDVRLGAKLGSWLEQHPQSYPAHQAMAQGLLAQAWRLRGGATMNLVSDRGRRGLHHFLEQAQHCAEVARGLTEKPLRTLLLLGDIANTHGNRSTLEQVQRGEYPEWYSAGLALEPGSSRLRQTLLRSYRAEWGGSKDHLLTFVRAQEGQLAPADQQRLWAACNGYLAHYALHFEDDASTSEELLRYAMQLEPDYAYSLAYQLCRGGYLPEARTRFLERLRARGSEADFTLDGKALMIVPLLFGPDTLYRADALLLCTVLERSVARGEIEAMGVLAQFLIHHPGCQRPGGPRPEALYQEALEAGDLSAALERAGWLEQTGADERTLMQAILDGANAGEPYCAALVWEDFSVYRRCFGLDERSQYTYLLRGADGGNNRCRHDLARQLRRGRVELGGDGVLRPSRGKPTQDSLEYAQHLLERARDEGYKPRLDPLRALRALLLRLGPVGQVLERWRRPALFLALGLWLVHLLANPPASPPRVPLPSQVAEQQRQQTELLKERMRQWQIKVLEQQNEPSASSSLGKP